MRNYSCGEHLCCLLQFTEQTFGIYLANHDIFFMWSSVYASLVYISWDWAACQGAGRWSRQTPPPALQDPRQDPRPQLLRPRMGTAPPLLLHPAAHPWGCSMVGATQLNPSLSAHRPSCTGAPNQACLCKDIHIRCLVHIITKKPHGASGGWIRRWGQWWRHTFLHFFPKKSFSSCGSCPPSPLASGSVGALLWLPTELGWPGVAAATVSPEALRCGPCTRPPSLATHDPPRLFRQAETFVFQPRASAEAVLSTPATCLVPPQPQPRSLLMSRGWFLPSQSTASRTGLPQSGAGPGQATGWGCLRPSQPPSPPYAGLSGRSSPKHRHSSNPLLLWQSDCQSWRNKIGAKFWLSSF